MFALYTKHKCTGENNELYDKLSKKLISTGLKLGLDPPSMDLMY